VRQGCISGGDSIESGRSTGAEWRILNPLLPDRGERGPPIPDKRRTVNGILWALRTSAPWRDRPERYGVQNDRSALIEADKMETILAEVQTLRPSLEFGPAPPS
jgi:hypothetical protein